MLIFLVNLCALSISLSIPRRWYKNVRCLFYTASPAWERLMKKWGKNPLNFVISPYNMWNTSHEKVKRATNIFDLWPTVRGFFREILTSLYRYIRRCGLLSYNCCIDVICSHLMRYQTIYSRVVSVLFDASWRLLSLRH